MLRRIRADHGYHAGKLRDLHFDVLIALTARSYGARLITSNRADFMTLTRLMVIGKLRILRVSWLRSCTVV